MSFAVPSFIAVTVLYALAKRTSIYDSFSAGAKEGAGTLFNIFPSILAIMVSVEMLRASGAADCLMRLFSPLTARLGFDNDIILMALVRPMSGGGAIGILGDILKKHGADSPTGLLAAIMMGSSETTFYTLSVYFSKTKVKYTKRAVPAAVFGDIVGLLASIAVCKIFF